MTRPRRCDDSGQIMLFSVCLTVICFAFLMFVVMIPLGSAADERTQSQTAADAAALAGAIELRDAWLLATAPGTLVYDPTGATPFPMVPGGAGQLAATDYAARNDGTLLTYYARPATGRTFAEVQNMWTRDAARGGATSTATAEMDIDFTDCQWEAGQLPAPPLAPIGVGPVAPGPPVVVGPPGPATFERTLTCGDFKVRYNVVNAGEAVFETEEYVGATVQTLRDDLAPRLVD